MTMNDVSGGGRSRGFGSTPESGGRAAPRDDIGGRVTGVGCVGDRTGDC